MEDGSLKAIAGDAEKAAKSTDKATKSADKYSKKNKGVAGATANGTKAFSKMTTGITGGLVPAYATLAANVFALTALFGVLSRNDAISKLEEGLEFTGRSAGRNLTIVADKLKEITDNAISAEQAMRTTAVGISAGFSESQMEGLAKVAKGAALALGRDMGDAMDRLTRGAAKLEPEILDELGIMVRLDRAVRDYAIAHNKATTELTQFERRMAFTNAIIADGISKYSALAESLNPSAYSQLSATFSDLTKSFIGGINAFAGPLLRFLAETPIALGALAAAFGAALSGQMMGGLEGIAQASAEAASRTDEMSKASLKAIKPNKLLSKGYNKLAKDFDGSRESIDKLIKRTDASLRQAKKGSASYKENTRQRKALTKEIYLQNTAQVKHTSANALGMIQTHGLSAALKVQAQAYRELATATTVATAGQGLFTKAAIIGRTAVTGLAMGVRFLGAAFLTIMPYIALAMMAFSLLSPLLGKLFKDNTQLGKAMKLNEERFEEFNEVANQYSKTIPHADNATSAWVTTLKPVAGMLTETATALQSAYSAANADRILRIAKAQKQMSKSTQGLASMAGMGPGAATFAMMQALKNQKPIDTKFTEKELQRLEKTATKAFGAMATNLGTMKTALEQSLVDSTVDGTAALGVLERASTTVNDSFTAYLQSGGGVDAFNQLYNAIKLAGEQASTAVADFESFNETVKKGQELIGDPSKTWGKYADEIDNLRESSLKINNVMKEGGDGNQMAADMLKAYGFKNGTLDSRLAELKALENQLRTINLQTKAQTAAQATLDLEKASGAGNAYEIASREIELNQQKQDTLIAAIAATQNDKIRNDLQKEFNDLVRQEMALQQQKFAQAAQKASESGMGGATAAAISGEGAINSALTAEDAMAAKVQQQKDILLGVSEQLAKIGPEGELMSSVIGGFTNMHTAFSTASQIMQDESASMSTKITTGLGAIGATIGAIGGMQKKASEARVRGIDSEIQAEKNRDGKSEQSMAKISALEKKKEAEQRKAFEQEKKMKIAQTLISTAQGAIAAYTSLAMIPIIGPALGAAAAAMVIKMGGEQVSAIRSTSFNGGGSAGGGKPEKISVGARSNSVDLASGNNAGGEMAYMRGAQGQGTGASNFTPAFSGYKHRAGGGYVVGEQGPEIFVPQTSGEIIPSGQEAGTPTNVNFSISAVDAAGVEELLINQQGNIIRMIREAANEHGELFLENIDDATYGAQ